MADNLAHLNDFFYSEKDKTLFFIPNNYYEDNQSNVVALTDMMMKRANKLAEYANRPVIEVKYTIVTQSTRYKRMYAYYISDVEPEEVRKHTFILGGDWDMYKWLKN